MSDFVEREIFRKHLIEKNLKATKQRDIIAEIFFSLDKHVSIEEIYEHVKERNLNVGYTTVYRTMRLLCDCNLAVERTFGDGQARYEHAYGHQHHDHLICMKCEKIFEFSNEEIEELQNDVAKKNKFKALSHKLEIYGFCNDCYKD